MKFVQWDPQQVWFLMSLVRSDLGWKYPGSFAGQGSLYSVYTILFLKLAIARGIDDDDSSH